MRLKVTDQLWVYGRCADEEAIQRFAEGARGALKAAGCQAFNDVQRCRSLKHDDWEVAMSGYKGEVLDGPQEEA
jgi:hypothetical protein